MKRFHFKNKTQKHQEKFPPNTTASSGSQGMHWLGICSSPRSSRSGAQRRPLQPGLHRCSRQPNPPAAVTGEGLCKESCTVEVPLGWIQKCYRFKELQLIFTVVKGSAAVHGKQMQNLNTVSFRFIPRFTTY